MKLQLENTLVLSNDKFHEKIRKECIVCDSKDINVINLGYAYTVDLCRVLSKMGASCKGYCTDCSCQKVKNTSFVNDAVFAASLFHLMESDVLAVKLFSERNQEEEFQNWENLYLITNKR